MATGWLTFNDTFSTRGSHTASQKGKHHTRTLVRIFNKY